MKHLIRDEMTSKERIQAFFAGRPYDRIPCNALIFEHAATTTGIKVAEYHHSPVEMARAQIKAYRDYGSDAVIVGPGLTGVAEALGSKVFYPDYGTPYIQEYGIQNEADAEKLKIADPKTQGRLPIILQALEILVEKAGGEVPVTNAIIGAFSNAANLRGTESFLRELYLNPGFVHRLLRIVNDSTIALIKESAKLGVIFIISDPTASGSLISPAQFREFALPYLKELVEAIKDAGAPAPQLHICGNTKKIWREMADTGAGLLSLDEVIDLEEAKRAVGDRVTLVGNVRPTESMYLGTPDKVIENAKENLRKAYDTPKGYILAPGCGIPIHSKPENIRALIGAAREYGKYPYDPERFK